MISAKHKCERCEASIINPREVCDGYEVRGLKRVPRLVKVCQECWEDEQAELNSEGTSRDLNCGLSGGPLARLEWFRKDRQRNPEKYADNNVRYGCGGHYFPPGEPVLIDGGVIRHGRLPEDEENFKPSSFCGLCVINPT